MFELSIAVVLVALNGLFALSELAIVSARRSRLKVMAEQGRSGAGMALRLAEDPGRFLSTVQIGITLIGILAGAFSGAALGGMLRDILIGTGIREWLAEPLGYGIVIGAITYFSVVIGELVPKQLALRNAEAIACAVAPMMALLARVGGPAVWLLDASTRLVFKLLGGKHPAGNGVTEDEIRMLVSEAEAAGVIEGDEKLMIGGVLRLGNRPVRGLMTPRTDVDWINLSASEEAIRTKLIESPHSRLPVSEGDADTMIGVVPVRELVAVALAGGLLDIRAHLKAAPVIPDILDALSVVDILRKAEVPMAFVHDEYGHFEGVVTPADVLEAIAGAFRSDAEQEDEGAVRREDGSWLLEGGMPADEMADLLLIDLPEPRDYQTVAGLLIKELKRLPETGECVDAHGWRFEVVDMDGRRIDKILASRA